MSQLRSGRVGSAVLVRASRSLLLALALVCAAALFPSAGPAAATQRSTGGGLIAYERDGEIYVRDASSGLTAKIVDNNNGVNMQPTLSPDASRVAFSSKRDGKFSIYIVGVDGQGLRRLTDGPDDDSEPAWSPDGSRIAFVRGFDATGSGVVITTCDRAGDILVVSADEVVEGALPAETNLTTDLGGTDPAWSPNGKYIAFASEREGSYDIYTMSSEDGSDVSRLTTDASAEADPSWSPDGLQIAYTGKLYEVWGGTHCGNMPIIGSPTGGGTGDDEKEGSGNPFASAKGPYIYRMMADGSQQIKVTDTDGAAEPKWSPDGSMIVFVGGRRGEDVDVYMIAWDGNGPWIHVTYDSAEESSPSWATAVNP